MEKKKSFIEYLKTEYKNSVKFYAYILTISSVFMFVLTIKASLNTGNFADHYYLPFMLVVLPYIAGYTTKSYIVSKRENQEDSNE